MELNGQSAKIVLENKSPGASASGLLLAY